MLSLTSMYSATRQEKTTVITTLEDGTIKVEEIDSNGKVVTYTTDGKGNNKSRTKSAQNELAKARREAEKARQEAEKALKEAERARLNAAKAQEKALREEEKARRQALLESGTKVRKESKRSKSSKQPADFTLFEGKPIMAVKNMTSWTIEYRHAATPKVEISGMNRRYIDNCIKYENGEIVVSTCAAGFGNEMTTPQIVVYSDKLRSLSIFGSGSIIADYLFGTSVNLSILGSGDLQFNEIEATTVKMIVNGSGDIDGNKVNSASLQAVVSGSGDLALAKVTVTSLECVAQGSGDIAMSGIDATSVRVSSQGTGDVMLSGRAEAASYTSRGSGDILVTGLKAKQSSQSSFGTGEIVR